jgi:hypothetical protein
VDQFTFGKQKSAVNLCDILTKLNNRKLTNKVSKYIHRTYKEQNWTIKRCEHLRKLYLKDKVEKVNKTNWPEDVKSHAICLIYAVTNDQVGSGPLFLYKYKKGAENNAGSQ